MNILPGYYWIKWDNKWFIAELDSINDWHIPGILSSLSTDDLEEIDERRIERQLPPVVLRRAFEAGMSAVTYNGRPGYPDAPKFDEWYQKWKDKS